MSYFNPQHAYSEYKIIDDDEEIDDMLFLAPTLADSNSRRPDLPYKLIREQRYLLTMQFSHESRKLHEVLELVLEWDCLHRM